MENRKSKCPNKDQSSAKLKLTINGNLPPNPYSEGVKVLLKLSINSNLPPNPYSEGENNGMMSPCLTLLIKAIMYS